MPTVNALNSPSDLHAAPALHRSDHSTTIFALDLKATPHFPPDSGILNLQLDTPRASISGCQCSLNLPRRPRHRALELPLFLRVHLTLLHLRFRGRAGCVGLVTSGTTPRPIFYLGSTATGTTQTTTSLHPTITEPPQPQATTTLLQPPSPPQQAHRRHYFRVPILNRVPLLWNCQTPSRVPLLTQIQLPPLLLLPRQAKGRLRHHPPPPPVPTDFHW